MLLYRAVDKALFILITKVGLCPFPSSALLEKQRLYVKAAEVMFKPQVGHRVCPRSSGSKQCQGSASEPICFTTSARMGPARPSLVRVGYGRRPPASSTSEGCQSRFHDIKHTNQDSPAPLVCALKTLQGQSCRAKPAGSSTGTTPGVGKIPGTTSLD